MAENALERRWKIFDIVELELALARQTTLCHSCACSLFVLFFGVESIERAGQGVWAQYVGGKWSSMPKLLNRGEIQAAIASESFLLNGDPSSAEAVKYDFHMGNRILKASYRQPKDINSIPEESRCVDPGEVVFVLTKEKLKLPRNMIATLIPKRKLAHKGVHIIGGLAVDPEYKGVLVVGLHNFSSTPFPLIPGMKLIAATFQRLEENELSEFTSAEAREIDDFPEELISLIQNYRPADTGALQRSVDDTRKELASLKNDLTTDREWRLQFQTNLDKQNDLLERTNKEIANVVDLIKEEAKERKVQDEKLGDRLNALSGVFGGLRVVWIVVALIVGGLVAYFIPKALESLKGHDKAVAQSNMNSTPSNDGRQ